MEGRRLVALDAVRAGAGVRLAANRFSGRRLLLPASGVHHRGLSRRRTSPRFESKVYCSKTLALGLGRNSFRPLLPRSLSLSARWLSINIASLAKFISI